MADQYIYIDPAADDSLGTVVKDGFSRYWTAVKRLWPGYLLVYVPMALVAWGAAALLAMLMSGRQEVPASVYMGQFTSSINNVFNSSIGLICVVATVLAVRDMEEGRDFEWKDVFRRALRRWPVAFAAWFLVCAVFMLGFCFCVVPAFILGTFFAFVLPIVACGDSKLFEAFGLSKSLVDGKWWETFGTEIVIGMISAALGMIFGFLQGLSMLPDIFLDFIGRNPGAHEISASATALVHLLSGSVSCVFTTLLNITGLYFITGVTVLYLRRRAKAQEPVA